jgi:hypothetical protein
VREKHRNCGIPANLQVPAIAFIMLKTDELFMNGRVDYDLEADMQ